MTTNTMILMAIREELEKRGATVLVDNEEPSDAPPAYLMACTNHGAVGISISGVELVITSMVIPPTQQVSLLSATIPQIADKVFEILESVGKSGIQKKILEQLGSINRFSMLN